MIKDTSEAESSSSYLDLHLEIGSKGELRTKFTLIWLWISHCKLYVYVLQHSSRSYIRSIYTFLCWYAAPGLVLPIRILLIDGCDWRWGYWTKEFSLKDLSHHFGNFSVYCFDNCLSFILFVMVSSVFWLNDFSMSLWYLPILFHIYDPCH